MSLLLCCCWRDWSCGERRGEVLRKVRSALPAWAVTVGKRRWRKRAVVAMHSAASRMTRLLKRGVAGGEEEPLRGEYGCWLDVIVVVSLVMLLNRALIMVQIKI